MAVSQSGLLRLEKTLSKSKHLFIIKMPGLQPFVDEYFLMFFTESVNQLFYSPLQTMQAFRGDKTSENLQAHPQKVIALR